MPNRNNMSHFAVNPQVDIQRSRFPMNTNIKFTGNAADIIPFYVAEVLPGDTFDVTTSLVCRMQTLIHPIMDDMYLDTYYFFVPNRLVWDNWQHFCGEPDKAWVPSREWTVPQIAYDFTILGGNDQSKLRESAYKNADEFCGTILDYMGCSLNPENIELITPGYGPYFRYNVNALPVRAYNKIYDDWFRDENLVDPINLYTGDNTRALTLSGGQEIEGEPIFDNVNDPLVGGRPYKAAKYHDYFTSALPQPQRGDPVNLFQELSGGSGTLSGFAPVYARSELLGSDKTTEQLRFRNIPTGIDYKTVLSNLPTAESNVVTLNTVVNTMGADAQNNTNKASPSNLWADLSNISTSGSTADVSLTVNDLRMAFQVQKFMERSARYGARYIELLKGMFGVTSPDARLQRSEYLGGHRVPITIHQIVNQTESIDAPLGNVGAMSLTTDSHKDFVHSFVEHGFVIGCCVVRYRHSYSQGRNRMWSRKTKYDFYWPVFANLGEQSILNKEIFDAPDEWWEITEGENVHPIESGNDVFGYQERWAEYRYIPDRVAGEMRPGVTNTLASWHLGDFYTTQPTLSQEWIAEDIAPIDRAIAVTSQVSNQFLFDVLVQNKATRPMPVYSIPGLADHH